MKRDARSTLTVLAREYGGESPQWPLTYSSTRQQELWERFWKKPQALIWAEQQMEFEVAIHVQTLVEAETPNAPSSVRTLLLQQMNSLLLTQSALSKAGYRVAEAGESLAAAVGAMRSLPSAARGSSRARLRAVPSDAGSDS